MFSTFTFSVPHWYLALEAILFNASSDTKCEHYSNRYSTKLWRTGPSTILTALVFLFYFILQTSPCFYIFLVHTTSIILRRKIILKLTKTKMNGKVLPMSIQSEGLTRHFTFLLYKTICNLNLKHKIQKNWK